MNPPDMVDLATLNQLDAAEFTGFLGGIYEHSPWVAQEAWPRRPFASLADLQSALAAVLDHASIDRQLGVLRAHPELAGKAAIRNELTADSRSEQSGAGLDRCSPEEFRRIQTANDAYHARFGFPFIIAVKGLDRVAIINAMELRLASSTALELAEAIRQVHRIAAFRLAQKIRAD